MAGIVENLLELSRSQADRLELQPQPTDLGQTTRDVIHKLVSKSAKHHINVHLPEE
jgi:signal transduction histidine kinase